VGNNSDKASAAFKILGDDANKLRDNFDKINKTDFFTKEAIGGWGKIGKVASYLPSKMIEAVGSTANLLGGGAAGAKVGSTTGNTLGTIAGAGSIGMIASAALWLRNKFSSSPSTGEMFGPPLPPISGKKEIPFNSYNSDVMTQQGLFVGRVQTSARDNPTEILKLIKEATEKTADNTKAIQKAV
jgi:hypothetical protein